MQNLPLSLTAATPSVTLHGAGNGFWYESATVTGDSRIIVESEAGDQVVLRPGQSMRIVGDVNTWYVQAYVAGSVIAANVIIGSGEFDDNNTTIATGSFSVTNFPATQPVSGAVSVSNFPATQPVSGAVSVSNFPASQAVSIAANVKTEEQANAYSGSFLGTSLLAAATPETIVAPGTNTNGVLVMLMAAENYTAARGAFLAKASAPANTTDGDMLCYVPAQSTGIQSLSSERMIKVPAGKGLYWITDANHQGKRYALYKVL